MLDLLLTLRRPFSAMEIIERLEGLSLCADEQRLRYDLRHLEAAGKIRRAPGRKSPTVVDGREVPIAWEAVLP